MSLLFLNWKEEAYWKPGISRQLLAVPVGCERKMMLDPFSVMINFSWCSTCVNKCWQNFFLPLLIWVAYPVIFGMISNILQVLEKMWPFMNVLPFGATSQLGYTVGITGSGRVCNIWNEETSETFWPLSQNQILRERKSLHGLWHRAPKIRKGEERADSWAQQSNMGRPLWN